MPITTPDIVYRLTTTSGSAGDSTASTPNASLGKYAATTVFAGGANTLFDDISGTENAASTVDYRAFYVFNNHGSLTLKDARAFLSAEVGGGASIAIAVDNIAPSAKGSSSAQGTNISTETTAPTAVGSFSSPVSYATGLSLGDLAPGTGKMVWVKRTASNSAAQPDGVTFAVTGDTDS